MKRKFIPLLLLPVLALGACGEINARPQDYEDPLVVLPDGSKLEGDKNLQNNLIKIIYDAKKDSGAVATDVLDEVLLAISESIYGSYADIVAAKDETAKMNLIKAHEVYQGKDFDAENISATAKEQALTRLTNTAERIENKIAKKLFKEINGSYTRNGYFYETDYLMSLRNSLKNVKNPLGLASDLIHDKVLITPDMDETNVFEKLLHKEYLEGGEFNYITKKIVPEIFREMLVEQYLFDSTPTTIGRAYARKVNIITINNRTGYPLFADALMNTYIDEYVNANTVPESHDFDIIETAWRGVGLDGVTAKKDGNLKEQAVYLLEKAGSKKEITEPNEFTGAKYTYYEGTSYGEMAEGLEKVTVNPNKTDSAKENEFTNNGEYTVAQGVQVKTNKILQESYTTDGWHIRNGGLTSLNETIRNRLFNIGVANALDKDDYKDRIENGVYTLPEKENNYVAKVNGRYFLKPITSERNDNTDFENIDNRLKDMLWIDQASGSFTIVEITEAVSSSKLAEGSDNNYGVKDFDKYDTISHEVAEVIAENESYRTLSTKYWLDQYRLDYHDDSIYEYFTENFPELFEDK